MLIINCLLLLESWQNYNITKKLLILGEFGEIWGILGSLILGNFGNRWGTSPQFPKVRHGSPPIYHTFCETFKLMKYRTPISLFMLLKNSPRDNMLLTLPKVNLDIQKKNFIFQASCIWNSLNRMKQIIQNETNNSIFIPLYNTNDDIQ